MYKQIIGASGVLRDIGPDGIARDETGQWMKGARGGLLALSLDGRYVLELVTGADSDARKAGTPNPESMVFQVIPGPTPDIGRVVQLDGTPFPNTPTTITDPKTGTVIEESELRRTMAAAGMGGGLSKQHLLLIGGLALLWFYTRRSR